MPTPVGHALGGLAVAFLTDSFARRPALSPRLLLAAGALAATPDLDLLFGSHRTYTHSIGAVAIVALVAWLAVRRRVPDTLPAVALLTAAYGSHLLLDWAGKDTSTPPGLTVLWPLSWTHYISGWDVFGEISRRYWLPREFILGNFQALAWELMVLVPLLAMAWTAWSGRTVKTKKEEGRRKND